MTTAARAALLGCAAALGAARPAAMGAQPAADSAQPPVGALVRLYPAGADRWYTGRLRAATTDSLVLDPCRACERQLFARASLRGALVRHGLPGTRVHHALLGTMAGALAGVGVVALGVRRCERGPDAHGGDGPPCGIGYVALPLVTLAGAFAGGLVGAALPVERWRPWPAARAGSAQRSGASSRLR